MDHRPALLARMVTRAVGAHSARSDKRRVRVRPASEMSRQFLLALLAFLAFISLGLPDGLLGVSWPSISAPFTIPLEALGLLVGVTTAGYLTSSYLGGAILRRLTIGAVQGGSPRTISAAP